MSTDFPLFGDHRNRETLQQHFQAQKAEISFTELETFYLQGVVVQVCSSLDLVKVALSFALNDSEQVEQWLFEGTIKRLQNKMVGNVYAVVVSPWVLVQEIK